MFRENKGKGRSAYPSMPFVGGIVSGTGTFGAVGGEGSDSFLTPMIPSDSTKLDAEGVLDSSAGDVISSRFSGFGGIVTAGVDDSSFAAGSSKDGGGSGGAEDAGSTTSGFAEGSVVTSRADSENATCLKPGSDDRGAVSARSLLGGGGG